MEVRCTSKCYGNCSRCRQTILKPEFWEDIEGFMLIIRKRR